ncbi:MAG TPA: hypothetical protein DC049_10805, partial [Spirochaetia bacterium]|nr:hypothetical protein [Spirochaetia bacterium]
QAVMAEEPTEEEKQFCSGYFKYRGKYFSKIRNWQSYYKEAQDKNLDYDNFLNFRINHTRYSRGRNLQIFAAVSGLAGICTTFMGWLDDDIEFTAVGLTLDVSALALLTTGIIVKNTGMLPVNAKNGLRYSFYINPRNDNKQFSMRLSFNY